MFHTLIDAIDRDLLRNYNNFRVNVIVIKQKMANLKQPKKNILNLIKYLSKKY